MIKFAYICDQSEEKKKECKALGLKCNPCKHTFHSEHAKNPQAITFANDILEKFECLEGQDVTLIEKEDPNGNNI